MICTRNLLASLLFVQLALVGCGGGPTPSDAGTSDAGAGGGTGGGTGGGGQDAGGDDAGAIDGGTDAGASDAGVASFSVSNFEARVGGCGTAVLDTGATIELRENLQSVCLTLTGAGLGTATQGALRGPAGEVAAATVGSVSSTSLSLLFSIPANVLKASAGQQRFLEVCLQAGTTALGCVPGVELTPIAASPSGTAGALGTLTSPLPSLAAALAAGAPGSTFQVMGAAPWGTTDVLALPAGSLLLGGLTSSLNGQGSATRQLQLGAGSSVSRVTITNFAGTALLANAGMGMGDTVTLDSVTLAANGTALEVNASAVQMKKGSADNCVLKDGTGAVGVFVRAGGSLLVDTCTLSGNKGDAIHLDGASAARLENVTGTSHLAESGTDGDDDAYLTLNTGTATVVSSSFSGSERSAIVVKGTTNTLKVAGGNTFTSNGTAGQGSCAAIAALGDGTTTVDQSEVQVANVFTDDCLGVFRAPTATNTVTIEDSQFVRTGLRFEGNLANVTLARSSVTDAPGEAGFYVSAPSTGNLAQVNVRDSRIEGSAGHGIVFFGRMQAGVTGSSTGTCLVKANARSGLYATTAIVGVSDCTFEENGWWGIALEGTSTAMPANLGNATIRGNGTDTAVSVGGLLVRNASAKLVTSPVTANRGYGVRLDSVGVSSVIPALVLEGAGPIGNNTGSGLEAASGTVTFTSGPRFLNNGVHGVHLQGATSFAATGLLSLLDNDQDGMRIEREFGAVVSVAQFDVQGQLGAGVRLRGGPGLTPTTGTVTFASAGGASAQRTFTNNVGGHIVDELPPSLTTSLNVRWTVTIGDNAVVTGEKFIWVRSHWTQVIVNGATITRAATPAEGTIVSARFGSAGSTPGRIKLSGTVTQNGATFSFPGAPCGGQQSFLPASGTGMAPFLDLNGTGDCLEP